MHSSPNNRERALLVKLKNTHTHTQDDNDNDDDYENHLSSLIHSYIMVNLTNVYLYETSFMPNR